MKDAFSRLSTIAARAAGHWLAFVLAVTSVVVWAITGPVFGFSEAWQLVINTGTTITTFGMVFLLQATQNRDTAAVHIKLDALIYASNKASNAVIGIEAEADPGEAGRGLVAGAVSAPGGDDFCGSAPSRARTLPHWQHARAPRRRGSDEERRG